jgi:hypothetical protein
MTDELAAVLLLILIAIATWLIFGTASYGIIRLLT